jgi:lipoprotein-anchoring transpeptidase ErfK/SrfK
MTKIGPSVVLLGLALWSCSADDSSPPPAAASDTTAVVAEWTEARLSSTQIDSARYEATWRIAPSVDSLISADSLARAMDSIVLAEKWDDIGTPPGGATAAPAIQLPLGGQVSGPSVLYAQILLDRSPFGPGVIDGKWGKNTEKAVFWLQHQVGLPATGQIDSATYRKLVELAGAPDQYVRRVALSAEDVAGPFQPLPQDIYEKAKQECLCYESLSEKLSERFHVTTEVLTQLNQGVSLDSLAAGDSLSVPNLDAAADSAAGSAIARVVISDQGRYLHALDSAGTILYHFPTTLGSTFYPSPEGRLEVTRITRNPWFHWQPKLLEGVPDTKKPARLPPGPNSPVGVVWIALSKEHFGIHGTNEPATIGYATSSGCVRLTNWDAGFLAGLVKAGTTVEFRDLGPRVVARN